MVIKSPLWNYPSLISSNVLALISSNVLAFISSNVLASTSFNASALKETHAADLKVSTPADLKIVTLLRGHYEPLGFSIRGGSEHGLGIYISEVESGSAAGQHYNLLT